MAQGRNANVRTRNQAGGAVPQRGRGRNANVQVRTGTTPK